MITRKKISNIKSALISCKHWSNRGLLFFALIISFSIPAIATCNDQSPIMSCASVLPNGDVTLTWQTPVNTGVFDSYHIFKSNSPGGPFVVLDSIFAPNQTTYTHVGANANIAPVYYYIQTRCLAQGFSAAINTVQTIFLNVTNPANGTALLTWNPIFSNAFYNYSIFQEHPTGVWILTGSKNNSAGIQANMNFIDTVYLCNKSNSIINYRVEVVDASGCISQSSVSGGTFQNTIVPAIPLFDTMSVDDNNTALMSWNISPSIDVEGYVIYKFNGASWIPVDSVLGINSTSYNYLSSNAGFNSEQYRLAAYDSCGNISPLGAVYSTIHLTATADICNRSATLNWTDYLTFNTGLSNFRIFQATAGAAGPYTLIGNVTAGVLTYIVSGLAPNTTYYYKIEAVDVSGTKTASSNRITFYSATPIPPRFLYLRKVSVLDPPNQVNLTCHIDVAAPARRFKIMRSLDTVAANYIQVGTIPPSKTSPILFTDNKVLTDNNSYYYKVISVDSCGYDGMQSNVSRTMLLSIVSNSKTSTNNLIWNDYEGWPDGVASYNIYRGIDGVMDPIPIANVPFSSSGINTYTDDVSHFLQGQGIFSYYIEATEGNGNTFGFNEISLSNTAEGYQDFKIFIPNAFFPDGEHNTVFKPVTLYVNVTDYQFQVFNRMGLQVFSTENLTEGWDGTYNGRICEFGVFVYMIRFKSSRGEYIDLKGSVTLLR